jgi:hypothetical protein
MRNKRQEKLLEHMIGRIYEGIDLPKSDKDPITKEALEKIVKNIAMEIVKAQSIANQAMY